MAVVFTATLHDTYPPRVVLALTGLTLGDAVDIYRQTGGNRSPVRGGSSPSVDDTSYATIDAELDFGIPVTYVAVVEGVEHALSPVTYTLPGGKVVLSDAITGYAAEVVILSASPKARSRDATRFRVAGRNVTVGQPLGGFEGTYELFIETTVALANLTVLLENATQGIVQIRQPGGYAGVDAYLQVDSMTVERWSQDGSDERRRVPITYAEGEPWPAALLAPGFTYADAEGFFAGDDYATAEPTYATYLEARQADYS